MQMGCVPQESLPPPSAENRRYIKSGCCPQSVEATASMVAVITAVKESAAAWNTWQACVHLHHPKITQRADILSVMLHKNTPTPCRDVSRRVIRGDRRRCGVSESSPSSLSLPTRSVVVIMTKPAQKGEHADGLRAARIATSSKCREQALHKKWLLPTKCRSYGVDLLLIRRRRVQLQLQSNQL